ncbi:MAG: PLP-dependent aminotransferase family protein [Bacillota bacterium]
MLEFSLALTKDAGVPIYLQLYEYIKKEITHGRIEPYTKLPSIRQLSIALKLSKTTVEASYQQLHLEGYISSEPKIGYFVNKIADHSFYGRDGFNLAHKKTLNTPVKQEYDFRNDHIDQDSFDFQIWKRYLNKAINQENSRFLTYGSHQGELELRIELAKYLHHSRGVICTPQQLVIGSGVQTLLGILCGLLKEDCTQIGFEDPGFKQARHIFKDYGFTLIPIKLEEDGINISLLEESRADLVYVSPSHQFPTGSVMPINKRIQLLNWAKRNKRLIIEDDYDSELRYTGRPIPSLQGLSEGSNVVYLGTFSKILLPSIRISYMVLPEKLIGIYEGNKRKYNQTSSQIEQIALSLFMQEGMLERHIRRLRKIYAHKNQLLIDAIKKLMGDRVGLSGVETGLHILLEVKTLQPPEEIAQLAEQVGVKVIPISNYFIEDSPHRYPLVLLSYGGIPIGHIEPAIKLLNQVWFNNG